MGHQLLQTFENNCWFAGFLGQLRGVTGAFEADEEDLAKRKKKRKAEDETGRARERKSEEYREKVMST